METKKTTIRIWQPLNERFESLVERNGLSRDSFLNHVLRVEIPYLENEAASGNSIEARRYIARALRRLRPQKLVTVKLTKVLLDRLDRLCAKKNIVRDSFFNRLYFLLTADAQVIDRAFFQGDSEWRRMVWEECKHDGPFYERVFFPLSAALDPFWAIRSGIRLQYEEAVSAGDTSPPDTVYDASLYKTASPELRDELIGLSCVIDDVQVRGSEAEKRLRKALEEFTGKPMSFWEAR